MVERGNGVRRGRRSLSEEKEWRKTNVDWRAVLLDAVAEVGLYIMGLFC